MLSKDKIRMMTQAAIYESRYYHADKIASRYYKTDYIGIERVKTKIWMTIFYAIALCWSAFDQVYVQQIDLLHYPYRAFLVKAVVIYLILNAVVSVITSAVYGPKYDKAAKRLEAYYRQLEKINLKE